MLIYHFFCHNVSIIFKIHTSTLFTGEVFLFSNFQESNVVKMSQGYKDLYNEL